MILKLTAAPCCRGIIGIMAQHRYLCVQNQLHRPYTWLSILPHLASKQEGDLLLQVDGAPPQ